MQNEALARLRRVLSCAGISFVNCDIRYYMPARSRAIFERKSSTRA